MGATILIIQFGLDFIGKLPAALSLAIIVCGGGVVYGLAAAILGAIPRVLLQRDKN